MIYCKNVFNIVNVCDIYFLRETSENLQFFEQIGKNIAASTLLVFKNKMTAIRGGFKYQIAQSLYI